MKTIAVIPARYDSSRFPGKPLADIHGKPMIWWVYQQAKKVAEFADIIVATDSEKILQTCENLDIKAIMTAKTHATGTDRIAEVATKIDADWYVNVQGDEPMIEPKTIQAVLPSETEDAQILTVKAKITDPKDVINPNITKAVTNAQNRGIFFTRAAVPFPKASLDYDYYKHLGLYSFSKAALTFFQNTPRGILEKAEELEMLRFIEHGWLLKCFEIISNSVAVDTPQDLERVRQLMQPLK